jgi:hypothetical protein
MIRFFPFFFFSIVLLSPSAVWRPSWTHTHL